MQSIFKFVCALYLWINATFRIPILIKYRDKRCNHYIKWDVMSALDTEVSLRRDNNWFNVT